jgi:hypothetical protein
MNSLERVLPDSRIFAIALGMLFFGGCRTTEDRAELIANPTIEDATGDITGYVVVVNGVQQRLGDKGGVLVTVEGTMVEGVTSEIGSYTLKNLPPGKYTLTWTKPDFGFSRRSGVVCRAGEIAQGPKMWIVQIPLFTLENLSGTVAGNSILMSGQIAGDTQGASPTIRFFVGHTADVRAGAAGYFYTEIGSTPAIAGSTNLGARKSLDPWVFSLPLDLPALHAAGGAPGSSVYVVAHADGVPSQSYIDQQTGGTVFTTISPIPSNVVRLILP